MEDARAFRERLRRARHEREDRARRLDGGFNDDASPGARWVLDRSSPMAGVASSGGGGWRGDISSRVDDADAGGGAVRGGGGPGSTTTRGLTHVTLALDRGTTGFTRGGEGGDGAGTGGARERVSVDASRRPRRVIVGRRSGGGDDDGERSSRGRVRANEDGALTTLTTLTPPSPPRRVRATRSDAALAGRRNSDALDLTRVPRPTLMTSALGNAIDAASSDLAPSVRSVHATPRSVRGGRDGRAGLLSDAALRRIVDRIYAEHQAMDDLGLPEEDARLAAAARGLTPREFDALPDAAWPVASSLGPAAEAAEAGGGGEDCAVCMVAFEPGDALKSLPCGHSAFHVECIRRWLERSPTCPLCRCACRHAGALDPKTPSADVASPSSGRVPMADVINRHLHDLAAMHEEESAWLDRLEAQPRVFPRLEEQPVVRRVTRIQESAGSSPGDGVRRERRDETSGAGEEGGGGGDRVGGRVGAGSGAGGVEGFRPFEDEWPASMRSEFSELYDLRREEAELSAQLERLAAHEQALERRIAEVRGRGTLGSTPGRRPSEPRGGGGGLDLSDGAPVQLGVGTVSTGVERSMVPRRRLPTTQPIQRRAAAPRAPTTSAQTTSYELSSAGLTTPRWRSGSSALDLDGGGGRAGGRWEASAAGLAAAERDLLSRVNAVDALARWRGHADGAGGPRGAR